MNVSGFIYGGVYNMMIYPLQPCTVFTSSGRQHDPDAGNTLGSTMIALLLNEGQCFPFAHIYSKNGISSYYVYFF